VKDKGPDKEVLQKRKSTTASAEKEPFRMTQLAEEVPHGIDYFLNYGNYATALSVLGR
ncbi:hypothetical protein L9F63_007170, partial [Diploptera punctata]